MQLLRSPLIVTAALAALSALPGAHAAAVDIFDISSAAPSKTTTTLPCTASATSGAFYDLRPDMVLPPVGGAKKPKSGVQITDYAARGHDYGSNFTLNICAAVVSPVKDVMGLDRDLWANVSAYYEHNGDVYSLGWVFLFIFFFSFPLLFLHLNLFPFLPMHRYLCVSC